MKSYLTPLLLTVANVVVISANADTPSYFTPSEPTLTTPANLATNVNITPELTSSNFQFTESIALDNDPTLSTSNWIISKKSDNITIFGSESASNNNLSNFSFEYDLLFPIKISGQTATKLSSHFNPDPDEFGQAVDMKDANGNVIAAAVIGFKDFDFQSDKVFIVAETTASTLRLQAHLAREDGTKVIAEFILLDNGLNDDNSENNDTFGWRTSPNELTNTLFDLNSHYAICNIQATNVFSLNAEITEDKGMSEWKEFSSSIDQTEFSLACSSTALNEENTKFELTYGAFDSPDITQLLSNTVTLSSVTNSYTLNDSEALNLSTEYNVQVQHIGIYGDLTGASSWSTPVSFTTRTADTNYQVTAPTDLAFTAGKAKDLALKISNTGSETGSPQVTIRLPFEALSSLNGTSSDAFKVSIGEQNCSMNQSGGKTDFICQLDSLAAAAEVQLNAKVTVKDIAVDSIEYQVCDIDKCDSTAFTSVNISVTESAASSSGGSTFWLFLMAPLLLIRRK